MATGQISEVGTPLYTILRQKLLVRALDDMNIFVDFCKNLEIMTVRLVQFEYSLL